MVIANIIASISIIIAAVTFIWGINAWRREHVGKRKIELAEETLALFYEARDAISAIRSPFGYAGEGQTRKSDPTETKEEKTIYDRAFTTKERYNRHSELFNRLRSMKYQFMALFGENNAEPFISLNKILIEILAASDYIAGYWLKQRYGIWENKEEHNRQREQMREYENIIWEHGKGNDTIKPKVDEMIEQIESLCLQVIDAKRQKEGSV
ncbi:hypothetical protein [Dehalococcoides mccartyi]|uniref:hypothetical protein n=1 Tax=Dehalococcoides mccartyi TaxID=61435 RepID=UPI0006BD48EE|nr:hypothetical protein [Dehalococcoides mccartyi]OBW61212.1 MAG: hypothetical protein A9183_03665 [Dehalococcoides mccartyi]QYY57816.1 hypothetical protein CWV2_001077 [Dehalococcoides mccartyi]BAS32090.1 hypothetical protein IBK_1047 [Dehalococcoides mccartyi IBARAKI]BEL01151.1 hypothetical protein DMOBY_10040 [Dehalococcoides mccartyi]